MNRYILSIYYTRRVNVLIIRYRPPQKADFWFSEHQRTCGGTFIKISEPESASKKRKTQSNTLLNYFENNDGNTLKNKKTKQDY
jgi:hypothetical protein